ncbi:MAG: phage major capsid protein [Actinobacteria bacterium]|nr:phage major capsid protein [Actinomycetota bacterium]
MPPDPPSNGGTNIAPLDFSGIIPIEYSRQIIERAVQQSVALSLGNTVPMGTSIAEMPVPRAFPKAGWVTAENPRKPYTDMALGTESMTAEEVAAVTAIPDKMIEDLDIDIWAWVRPRLAEAIAAAIDDAILFGVDAPATFPVGGVVANSVTVPAGRDAVDTVNTAMSAVEVQGVPITGHAADIGVRGVLRGVRDDSGGLLLGTAQVGSDTVNTLYGYPISYQSFSQREPDFITGNWDSLIIGVRQDIRYEMNPAAVLADDEGRVVISGFQDNMLPLKVWARFACVIVEPITRRSPEGADPFASTTLVSGAEEAGGLMALISPARAERQKRAAAGTRSARSSQARPPQPQQAAQREKVPART